MFTLINIEFTRRSTRILAIFAVISSIALISPLLEDAYSAQHEQNMVQNRTHQMLQNQSDNPLMLHEQKMMQNRTHQIPPQ